MDEQTLRAALGAGSGSTDLLAGWSASQADLPAGLPFFLEPNYVVAAAQEAALDSDLAAALATAAWRVAANPAARALTWHIYRRLFHVPSFDGAAAQRWPFPSALLGDDASLIYALALFGGLPALRALDRAHAVPDQVRRETLHDIQRWANYYRRHHGAWGLGPAQLSWLRLHLRGELYSLGRLQFQPGAWALPARAFRHRMSGAVTALSEDGVRYRADGRRDGTGGVHDPVRGWTARLQFNTEVVVGHHITPDGSVERVESRLATADWAQALAPGDPVLHLHIPRGDPLDLDACRRSLEAALRFFPTHFPEQPFVAFACESWLLDDQLSQLLPASSNLARFQRQLYLVPVIGDNAETLGWVFDGVPTDLAQAPRDTSLRRAVLDHLLSGGHFRGGGCFLLPEDLPAWGTDIYRRT
jgi:hypothetical protein